MWGPVVHRHGSSTRGKIGTYQEENEAQGSGATSNGCKYGMGGGGQSELARVGTWAEGRQRSGMIEEPTGEQGGQTDGKDKAKMGIAMWGGCGKTWWARDDHSKAGWCEMRQKDMGHGADGRWQSRIERSS